MKKSFLFVVILVCLVVFFGYYGGYFNKTKTPKGKETIAKMPKSVKIPKFGEALTFRWYLKGPIPNFADNPEFFGWIKGKIVIARITKEVMLFETIWTGGESVFIPQGEWEEVSINACGSDRGVRVDVNLLDFFSSRKTLTKKKPIPQTIKIPDLGESATFYWIISGKTESLIENPEVFFWIKGKNLGKHLETGKAEIITEWRGGETVSVPTGEWSKISIKASGRGIIQREILIGEWER